MLFIITALFVVAYYEAHIFCLVTPIRRFLDLFQFL